jgi:hemerythrin-like domain-containing protein
MKITESLTAEHAVFRVVYDFIEFTLTEPSAVGEVKLLGSLVGALLCNHAEAEENLVLVALDHALAENGQLDCFYQEHREIDDRLKHVQMASEFTEARRLLIAAMRASRRHFDHEEQTVFPLMEKTLQAETLAELNQAWMRRRKA